MHQRIPSFSNLLSTVLLRSEIVPPATLLIRSKKGYHEWLVEFVRSPQDKDAFTEILDRELGKYNDDYASKRRNDVAIEKPVVREMPEGTFYEWLKRKNKLGGQHKVPRLSNGREFVEELLNIKNSMRTEI